MTLDTYMTTTTPNTNTLNTLKKNYAAGNILEENLKGSQVSNSILINFFNQRAIIEKEYCEKLRNLSKIFDDSAVVGRVKSIFEETKNELLSLSDIKFNLYDLINNQYEKSFAELSSQQNEEFQKYYENIGDERAKLIDAHTEKEERFKEYSLAKNEIIDLIQEYKKNYEDSISKKIEEAFDKEKKLRIKYIYAKDKYDKEKKNCMANHNETTESFRYLERERTEFIIKHLTNYINNLILINHKELETYNILINNLNTIYSSNDNLNELILQYNDLLNSKDENSVEQINKEMEKLQSLYKNEKKLKRFRKGKKKQNILHVQNVTETENESEPGDNHEENTDDVLKDEDSPTEEIINASVLESDPELLTVDNAKRNTLNSNSDLISKHSSGLINFDDLIETMQNYDRTLDRSEQLSVVSKTNDQDPNSIAVENKSLASPPPNNSHTTDAAEPTIKSPITTESNHESKSDNFNNISAISSINNNIINNHNNHNHNIVANNSSPTNAKDTSSIVNNLSLSIDPIANNSSIETIANSNVSPTSNIDYTVTSSNTITASFASNDNGYSSINGPSFSLNTSRQEPSMIESESSQILISPAHSPQTSQPKILYSPSNSVPAIGTVGQPQYQRRNMSFSAQSSPSPMIKRNSDDSNKTTGSIKSSHSRSSFSSMFSSLFQGPSNHPSSQKGYKLGDDRRSINSEIITSTTSTSIPPAPRRLSSKNAPRNRPQSAMYYPNKKSSTSSEKPLNRQLYYKPPSNSRHESLCCTLNRGERKASLRDGYFTPQLRENHYSSPIPMQNTNSPLITGKNSYISSNRSPNIPSIDINGSILHDNQSMSEMDRGGKRLQSMRSNSSLNTVMSATSKPMSTADLNMQKMHNNKNIPNTLNYNYDPYDISIIKPILFYVRVLFDYNSAIYEEISVRKDMIIPILETQEDGWWEGEIEEMGPTGKRRRRGLLPSNFVEIIKKI